MPIEDDVAGLLKLAGCSGQPIAFSLQAAGTLAPSDQVKFLNGAFDRYGGGCPAEVIRAIDSYVSALDPEMARSLSSLIHADGATAASWLRVRLAALSSAEEAAKLIDAERDLSYDDGREIRFIECARLYAEAGCWKQSAAALAEALRNGVSTRTYAAAEGLMPELRAHAALAFRCKIKVALLGPVTTAINAKFLETACAAAGIDASVYAGGAGQWSQEILDPDSPLCRFQPDVIVLATAGHCLGLPEESADPGAAVELSVNHLRQLWRAARTRFGCDILQYNFEAPPDDPLGLLSGSLPGGRVRVIGNMNAALARAAAEEPGVFLFDIDRISAKFGSRLWNDPTGWLSSWQYPSVKALPYLVRHQTAALRALRGLSAKCLVLDLDGVLWGGVVGEDGVSGIRLDHGPSGEAYLAFQRHVRALRNRGIVLAVCSKNNLADAKLPFTSHPDMILKLEDFAAFVANWDPKPANLRRISQQLGLGLDSFVFVDDSPVEREAVRRTLPEVQVPEMPSDAAHYVRTLDECLAFEALSMTAEDRTRADTYIARAQLVALEDHGEVMEQYLTGLETRVEILPFAAANLRRITQLINKTNQFNLTTRRMHDNEVKTLAERPDCYTQAVSVRDRFADYGLTGVLIAFERDGELEIDTCLMSCRVLGRQIEKAMVRAAMDHARRRGLLSVRGRFVPTAKNEQVLDLYERLGFAPEPVAPDGSRTFVWRAEDPLTPRPRFLTVSDSSAAEGICQLSKEVTMQGATTV